MYPVRGKPKMLTMRIRYWFWSLVEHRFSEWDLTRRRHRLERQYDADIAAAKAKGNWDEVNQLEEMKFSETRACIDAREQIVTRRLLAKAEQFTVSLDEITLPNQQESHWERDAYGHYSLTRRSFSALRKAVHQAEREYSKERQETWEFRVKVLTALLTAITGLVGAFIGLVALLKK